jgi:hypothetical protein
VAVANRNLQVNVTGVTHEHAVSDAKRTWPVTGPHIATTTPPPGADCNKRCANFGQPCSQLSTRSDCTHCSREAQLI